MSEPSDFRSWILVRDPNCVPAQKGPFRPDQVAPFLRELMAARPYSYLTVVTVHDDRQISSQDGPECLMMLDGRSRRTAMAHIERLRQRAPAQKDSRS